MQSKLSIALLSLVSLVVSVTVAGAGDLSPLAGGFGDSCDGVHLVGDGGDLALAATCANKGGGNNGEVTVPLSQCLINANGALVCQSGGGAMGSCGGCFLNGNALTCSCGRANGGTDLSTIDLNGCVGNEDGNLIC